MKKKDDWWDGTREVAISELVSLQRHINIPFGPLQSTGFVFETIDNDDVAYTFDAANYVLDTAGPYGRVALRLSAVWPATVLRTINGIRLTCKVGYGDTAASIPDDLLLAHKMMLSHLYEHRGDESVKVPSQVLNLCDPYRRIKV